MSLSASMAAQVLVTSYPVDWASARGDLIKRAYWHCFLIEWFVHDILSIVYSPVDHQMQDTPFRARLAAYWHHRASRKNWNAEFQHALL